MTEYLIRKIHHTTGEVFLDATKAKENEEFIVVDAESAEEAKTKAQEVFNSHPDNVSLPREIINVSIEEDE